jgi:hypothetical protein
MTGAIAAPIGPSSQEGYGATLRFSLADGLGQGDLEGVPWEW